MPFYKWCSWNGRLGSLLIYRQNFNNAYGNFCIRAVASHILARILKTPVTTMLIPAILTIVPGAGMYQTVYNLFLSDMDGALSSLVYTIGAAGAIAIAIFLVDAFVVAIKKIVKKRPQTD